MPLFLCQAASVDAEQPPVFTLPSGVKVAVFRVGDNFHVIDDLCTHGEASLAEGLLEGYEIECPFHQGRFDIRSGAATAAPCRVALRTYAVVLQDGGLYIDLPD